MKTIFLGKRGCDFFCDEDMAKHSDCENYRVCGEIVDKYGRNLFVEFSAGARYIRDKNKQHVENYRKLYVNTCFRNYDGSFRDIHMEVEVKNKDYDYTKDGIVKALNLLSDKKYDKVIIVDNMPDLSCGNPRITDEDRNYLYNLMGVTEEELTEKSMRTHRRWVVENMVAYKKINDGKTIEIYYQTPCGYDAIRFDVETKEFERRLVA